MLLTPELQKEVTDYYSDIVKYHINNCFEEFKYSCGRVNYNIIIERLANLNLPHPKTLIFSHISLEELKTYLTEIMVKIFGSSYQQRIEFYNTLLRLCEIENPYEAVLEERIEGDDLRPEHIYISKELLSIQVVTTGHEYVHCLQSPYGTSLFNEKITNIHYQELLSIIVEYIICYELSKILADKNLVAKHKQFRIAHDSSQAKERMSGIEIKLKRQRFNKTTMISKYITYQYHNSFGYIISDIYGSYLANIYRSGSKNLIPLIKSIIDGEASIADLIEYYHLSLQNFEVINNYHQQIDQVLTKKYPN